MSFKAVLIRKITLLTLSFPRVINFKFPLQPQQKYDITKYEELGFSYSDERLYHQFSLLHLYNFFLEGWENVDFELGSERGNLRSKRRW